MEMLFESNGNTVIQKYVFRILIHNFFGFVGQLIKYSFKIQAMNSTMPINRWQLNTFNISLLYWMAFLNKHY